MIRATNWIGDAVMSLPAIEALEARFPTAEIVLVAKPWVSDVYSHSDPARRIIVYDSRGEHQGMAGFSKLIGQLQSERFDAAVLFQNAFHAAWMAWRAGIPVRIGYARDSRGFLLTDPIEPPPAASYGHQTFYYLHLLFRAGLIARPEPPRPLTDPWLSVGAGKKNWVTGFLESSGLHGPRFLAGLFPGAAFGPAKRWFPDRFAALADRLVAALSADVLIFGSQTERPLAEDIARQMSHTPILVAGEITLGQSMTLMEQCGLIVTNDSGSMHVAAALGLPVVAIFGSTDARATGPLGPNARVIQHLVPCNPCGLRTCPIDFRCMEGMTVATVYRAALELVKASEKPLNRPAHTRGS